MAPAWALCGAKVAAAPGAWEGTAPPPALADPGKLNLANWSWTPAYQLTSSDLNLTSRRGSAAGCVPATRPAPKYRK